MKKDTTYKEILAEKYYDYFEEYTLYDLQEIYYPYYGVNCRCFFREKTSLNIVEETFLKAIKFGIQDLKLLEEFIGLDKEIFDEITAKLHSKRFFIQEPMLLLTDNGKEALDGIYELEVVEGEKLIAIDGITGRCLNISTYNEIKKREKKNKILPQIIYPRTESFSEEFFEKKSLQTVLFEWIKEKEKEKDLKKIFEIKEIEKTFSFFKKYDALFFKKESEEDKFLILENNTPSEEITNKLIEFSKMGKNIFNFTKDGEESKRENKTKKTINEYAEIPNLKTGTQLSTYEHPKFLKYLLSHSKKEAIIISPWIRFEVIEKYEDDIKSSLGRGVDISFFYGMGKEGDIDKKTSSLFQNLSDNYKNFKFSKHRISDHSKILICDRDWMLTSSFNFTSFKGDESMSARGEWGTFNREKSEISKVVKNYIK